jgi:TonB family protein
MPVRTLTNLICLALAVAAGACATRQPAPVKSGDFGPPLSTSTATASLGSPAFGNFVRSREPQLQFCYADTRAQNPNLAGSATVAVTLAADGNVLDAGIVRRSWSGKGADVVESCVLARVKSWRFPANQLDDQKQVLSFAVVFTR